ncbi:hypothetical protein J3459_006242 [Metarhizium acridum]|uniref:Cytochrome P450 alkane hydroxylase n=1 Tax=Metarhizium acridum (strain CQMa 102) TaxID=655827 RepID=E9EIQ1_METAQ|nr:cytochrome P450 alkane hydroxylase [Metarhizium acridum CQMa 102]EFY84206.1 cytochrome P450 alkane hydroxylase [Metarhizium acridum CQMa 102]KAG8427903.1 hypothetical protein J3459_006242 [Metarhizium acridum]
MSIIQEIWSAPSWIIIVAISAFAFSLVWIRHKVAGVRIQLAGGARAPVLAANLFSATKLYIDIGSHQYNNKLAQWCNDVLDSKQTNYAEFSLTGKKRVLITREPEQIKTILATKFANFGHGPQWHRLWRPFLGDGIFATDGDDWHRSRGLIRPMFVKDRLRNLVIFDNCTRKLLSRLPPSGTTIDIKDLFYRWTLDTTTDFLLGENTNSLDNPHDEVAEAMSVAQRIQMYIFVLNPIAPLIPKGEYYRCIRKLEEFIEPIIQRAISLPQHELEELSKIDSQYTFLHSIARVTKDPKVIRDEIMSVLLAGRDTTAATLSWVMYEMAYVPETWAKLREEILNELGPHGMPTYETLKKMQYLKNVLNEVLRLHPAVPINMRQALEDTVIPGAPGQPDVALLKGDTVTINTIGMHARKDLYPPISKDFADPAVFSPERWEHWIPTPWTYTPFSGGPRICVGQNFALTEMAFCLVRLAQTYERLEYRGDWHAQRLRADIIGTPALEVPIALFEP